MSLNIRRRLRVFVDADVLVAGAAALGGYGGSLLILHLAEIALIDAVTLRRVVVEAERTLAERLPEVMPVFRLIVSRCLRVVPDPQSAHLASVVGQAKLRELPILAAAVRESCPWLVSFNVGRFRPGHPDVTVLRPGDYVSRLRDVLSRPTDEGEEWQGHVQDEL